MTLTRTRAAVVAVALVVAAAWSVLLAPGADAATYRYWTYWWGDGTGRAHTGWLFASTGPAGHTVSDQAVVGWRFATSTSTTGTAKPRQSSSFASLCPSLDAPVDGKVRVALVVDYGTTSDAPPGQTPPSTSTVRVECLALPASPRPTGATALNAAGVPVRSESGLICALDGYPQGECAPVVDQPSPTPTPTRSSARPTPAPTSGSTAPRTSASTSAAPPTSSAASAPASTAASASTSSPTSASAVAAALPSTDASPSTSDEATLPAASGTPTGAPAAAPGSPIASALGVAAVVALAGAAFWLSRRRS